MLVFTNSKGRVHLQSLLDTTITDAETTPSVMTDQQEKTNLSFKPR